MKKRLLFVHPSMHFGGGEKSLQTLLSLLDYNQYDVDLALLRREGELLKLLPEDVHILSIPGTSETFSLPIVTSCMQYARTGKIGKAIARLRFSKAVRGNAPMRTLEQRGWRYQREAYAPIEKEYDVAIAYLEGSPIYYCADFVKAKKKICYIHNDYKKLQMEPSFDSRYFEQFDILVTVSEECAASLRDSFPEHKEKVRVVENILSPVAIRARAQEQADFGDAFEGLRVLTMGRLESQKGLDMAVQVCANLKDKYDFRWYVLGEGPQRAELQQSIKALGLEERFVLLGTRLNPYPYLRVCDIYAQPSRFEGKSIALEEAKAMGCPILTTNFTTVADQITDGVNGSIAQISVPSITERLEELLADESLRKKYAKNLETYAGNLEELQKFYALLE